MTKEDMFDEMKMQYALLEHIGDKLVGPPKGPFAIYDEEMDKILVFGARPEDVRHSSLTGNTSDALMEAARAFRATFEVDTEKQVTCCIGSHSATAESYALAALKAITLELRSRKENG